MWIGTIVGAVLIAALLAFPKKTIALGNLIFFLWFGGAYWASRAQETFRVPESFSETVIGEGRVIGDPVARDFFRQVTVRFETCASQACPQTDILWQAPLSFALAAGTRLAFSCQLTLPENFTPDFDYRMYLAKEGIGSICIRAADARVLPSDRVGTLRALPYVPKHVLERALSKIIPEPEAALAKGLLLGGDMYLPQSLKEAFTKVGLSHMIAVSGYNITLIAEMLLALGLFCGLWRRQAIWTALFGVVFFVIMIGLPASAARAGTMASIVFIALQTGRLARPVNALLFAGGVMVLLNPLLLRYDLGFQLSFLATLGILWVAPYYERFAPRGWFARKFWEITSMTVAVELFVLPIILLSFHTFSPLIIVGNFLVVLVPFAMAASFGAAVLFLLIPGGHLFPAWIAFGVLTLITRSVAWLGSMDTSITASGFGVAHLVMWYILLGTLIMVLRRFFPERDYAYEL